MFLRNGIEQGRARGIRGRLYPFVSMDSELDQITLLGETRWRLQPEAACCAFACISLLGIASNSSRLACSCLTRLAAPQLPPALALTQLPASR